METVKWKPVNGISDSIMHYFQKIAYFKYNNSSSIDEHDHVRKSYQMSQILSGGGGTIEGGSALLKEVVKM